MLPLAFAGNNQLVIVKKLSGSDEIRKHLSNLGFVDGAVVNVISSHDGDIIVSVKESRLAITKEMAEKIKVLPVK